MDSQPTLRKRTVGILNSRLPELDIGQMADPRQAKGRKWKNEQLVTTALVALMAGRKSTAEAESLTDEMSPAMRKQLGINRRVPDTTLRDWLCRSSPDELRQLIHNSIHAAKRRNALEPLGFPLSVASMDGKCQVLPCWDNEYAQHNTHEESGLEFGYLRTVTSCLITAAGQPCLDAFPIPASTNEMGVFRFAFEELMTHYKGLVDMIFYDAGASSEDNADIVVAAEKHYTFHLKDERRLMYQWAKSALGHLEKPAAKSVDWLSTGKVAKKETQRRKKPSTVQSRRKKKGRVTKKVVRKLFIADSKPTKKNLLVWKHTRTLIRVRSETFNNDKLVSSEDRYFNSSLPRNHLTDEQWLLLIRYHWKVENNCHHTYDKSFREDERPWIKENPRGTLAVTLIRRVAYNLLTLFRSRTLRSKKSRATAWQTLMRWVYKACIAVRENEITGLRKRPKVSVVDCC
jgi:hypothetical protein